MSTAFLARCNEELLDSWVPASAGMPPQRGGTFSARWNEELLDENYARWQKDPASVGADWASFFEGFELGFARYSKRSAKGDVAAGGSSILQSKVENLINAYRTLGHRMAHLDPLTPEQPTEPLLELSALGFSKEDLGTTVSSPSFRNGVELPLETLIQELRAIYACKATVEYMHIQTPAIRDWVKERVEQVSQATEETSHYRILRTLHKAELFENFLHTTYVGSKRFSIEGGESLMVALSEIRRRCAKHQVKEIILGMAHRGRLNVLANFLKKPFAVIFNEFSEQYTPDIGEASGDVKYHLGYHTTRSEESEHPIEVYLTANPSHLEAVDPVVMGKARAHQRILGDTERRSSVLPVLVHGDGALIGQGIVAECLNLSQLAGYRVGGTVHLVVNNQIGFTTLPEDARSTTHCTDIAKFIEVPIFHVNGDDPIAVTRAARLALEFRQEFGQDVFVDIVCYRRYGHNEGDEPSFTQPDLYKVIKSHPRVSEVFLKEVLPLGTITEEEAAESKTRTLKHLENALAEMKKGLAASGYDKNATYVGSTAVFQQPYSFEEVPTAITATTLKSVAQGLTTIPESFGILPKIKKTVIERRQEVFKNKGPYDWGFGEALAFGSLLLEGTPVRLSGQDSRRGTFSHRHSVFYDEVTRDLFIPLHHLAPEQAKFCVYNSPLSEVSVLGFDYGYSLDYPQMLCIWEAQFGDFANGAQVIIDQFIASSETKWLRPTSLVMLLPHGYEGQGPEHSSARLERYLQLCAEENMQVCHPTTPAQYFHLLRRQMKRNFRKPLIVMTPKSLLRSEAAVSREEDFTSGTFQEILEGPLPPDLKKVDRVILCSGKVYYDLLAYRNEHQKNDTAIIRVEQLYPLHEEKIKSIVHRYSAKAQLVWCQEEPQNMGAYSFIEPHLRRLFARDIQYAGRDAGASTAAGALSWHRTEQATLVAAAFGENKAEG
ncbi:MAG: 2-oxoglutarate dehydrogenase E1 component [Verrucomicrobiae bacterium]|nr:2-oxoglutarate dehydrogenase E1 component [Verrucomicrobiae bacterium]